MKQKFTSNGWLVVNKPEGVESFGVIRKLKFRYQFNKIPEAKGSNVPAKPIL